MKNYTLLLLMLPIMLSAQTNNTSASACGSYIWNDSTYTQIGADIDGEAADDQSGYYVSLSSDGLTVAIGARYNDGNGSSAGHVRIYSWDGISSWNQLGADIDGEAEADYSGKSVSLSSDGLTVAIGAPANNNIEIGSNSGHVRIYSWDGNSWNQLGADIDGEAVNDYSGWSVSLSSDGMTVAIGAIRNDENGSNSGHVRIYSWDGSSWNQLGADIDGEAADDYSGNSVSLSSNGMTVAIGARYNDNINGERAGHVRIYSVESLDLTINNSNTGVDAQEHCDTYTWIDGNTYTSPNNTATWTLTNSAGCDSVVTLDLTINNSNTGVDAQEHCDTYTWIDGNTYTSSNNTATWTLTNSAGCDSVVTLDLTIKPSPEQLIINQYWSTTFNTGESFAYQWYLNGEILENNTTQLLNFIQGGSYTVEAINSFGCKTMSEAFVIGTLDRNFDTEIDFITFPNPTKNLVFIELMEELGADGNIIVSDLVGQILKKIELKESASCVIDFSIFKDGPYIITVKYPNGLKLSKTIIKN